MRIIKLLLNTIVMLLMWSNVSAQKDTLWYNIKWKKVDTKTEASFFRPPIKKQGDLYKVQDYFISGKVQMIGVSKFSNKDFWHGKVIWYNEDGLPYQEGTYKDNRLDGDYISYIGKKKIVSVYKEGVYVSGKTNVDYGRYFVYGEETAEGFKEIRHGGNLSGARYEEFFKKGKVRRLSKFYDNNGEYLGESKDLTSGKRNGLVANYTYEPFRLSGIQYYSNNGEFLGTTTYYKNGKIREKFIQKPSYKSIYYNLNGKEIGAVTYRMRNSYLNPENGVSYSFSPLYQIKEGRKSEAWPVSITTYENGKMVTLERKYKDQTPKSLFKYIDGNRDLDIFYGKDGTEIARLTYKNYKPYNGVFLDKNVKKIFKEGALVEEIKTYPETEKKFMIFQNNTETYYDLEGKVLGTLTLDKGNYNQPLDGFRYNYYKGVYERIEEYKNGKKIKQTNLRKGDEDIYYKNIEIFDDSGYSKIREMKFYSNDKVQSDVTYSKYNPEKGVFFSMEGKELGSYDYKLKEGIRYSFFYNSDQIEEIEEIKNGKQIRNIRYTKVYDYDARKYNYTKTTDVDLSKGAKYYDKEGKLLAEASFKNGVLYNGTIYNSDDRSLYHINYGKKNGLFEKYNYYEKIIEKGTYKNDLKEGLFVTYDGSGVKKTTKNFVADKLDGDYLSYDKEGKIISKLVYEDGKAYEGKLISNKYSSDTYQEDTYQEDTYNDGDIVESINVNKGGKTVSTYSSKNSKEVIHYTVKGAKSLEYNLSDNRLDGKVISYDEKGGVLRTAEFEEGKLVFGKVRIKDESYGGDGGYIMLIRTNTTFAIEKYNADGLEYKAFEKVDKGMRLQHLYKLNSKVDYIYPADIQ